MGFSLSSCTSWLIFQIQLLGIVLHTPQHHGEVLQSQTGSEQQTALLPRSLSTLFLVTKLKAPNHMLLDLMHIKQLKQ